ncbi:hypothetical protein [Hydrogenophaga laconesensis]|uniref:RDD family membrane protein YckC n=1 Tax=Hydrogenophaga laconesensis TaxID=1805971 RepID=A0ABU1VCD0_9BURK|nr:hypothetical protein [Hydrogenophaga laconesensis]MDR7095125.1 putative RDD family membrane protein YckC [Hydrogenophaga laconesensis]
MVITLLVFVHLIATCTAIGTLVLTDLRLIARATGYRVVIPPPERLETRIVAAALLVLYFSGAALIALGMRENSDYIANPKLQAKLLLVVMLTLNAFILHRYVFPILGRSLRVSAWSNREWFTVVTSVSLSNSLWFYCAFLGVARHWSGTVPLEFVLLVGLMIWAVVFCLANGLLALASRDNPRKKRPDWLDSIKARLRNLFQLRDR